VINLHFEAELLADLTGYLLATSKMMLAIESFNNVRSLLVAFSEEEDNLMTATSFYDDIESMQEHIDEDEAQEKAIDIEAKISEYMRNLSNALEAFLGAALDSNFTRASTSYNKDVSGTFVTDPIEN
jgi:hypothetical protein